MTLPVILNLTADVETSMTDGQDVDVVVLRVNGREILRIETGYVDVHGDGGPDVADIVADRLKELLA